MRFGRNKIDRSSCLTDVQNLKINPLEITNPKPKYLIKTLGCSIVNLRRFNSLNKLYISLSSWRLTRSALSYFKPAAEVLRTQEFRSVVSRYYSEGLTGSVVYVKEAV